MLVPVRAVRAGQCAVAVRRIDLLVPITAEFVSAASGEWTITARGQSTLSFTIRSTLHSYSGLPDLHKKNPPSKPSLNTEIQDMPLLYLNTYFTISDIHYTRYLIECKTSYLRNDHSGTPYSGFRLHA